MVILNCFVVILNIGELLEINCDIVKHYFQFKNNNFGKDPVKALMI